ncbi:MAG: hypothetical protein ACE5JQ_16000 [Candidatus Methylomirabilales bacterium]
MDQAHNGYPCSKTYFLLCLLAVGISLAGCGASQIRDGAHINAAKGFLVELPSEAWNVETNNETDLVLRHKYHHAGILINATCGEIPSDRSPDIGSPHRFFGFQRMQLLQEEPRAAGPGDVREVVLQSKFGGRERILHGYTLKVRGCLYDLLLFSSPEDYSGVNREFEALVRRFQL